MELLFLFFLSFFYPYYHFATQLALMYAFLLLNPFSFSLLHSTALHFHINVFRYLVLLFACLFRNFYQPGTVGFPCSPRMSHTNFVWLWTC
jgi:hypothetical protein